LFDSPLRALVGRQRGDNLRRQRISRITLRVGLSRSSHLTISSLGHRPTYYFVSLPFSFSVGERKIMKHFVVWLNCAVTMMRWSRRIDSVVGDLRVDW